MAFSFEQSFSEVVTG